MKKILIFLMFFIFGLNITFAYTQKQVEYISNRVVYGINKKTNNIDNRFKIYLSLKDKIIAYEQKKPYLKKILNDIISFLDKNYVYKQLLFYKVKQDRCYFISKNKSIIDKIKQLSDKNKVYLKQQKVYIVGNNYKFYNPSAISIVCNGYTKGVGNNTFKSFNKSKKILLNIYKSINDRKTIYCGCSFKDNKQIINDCGFKINKYKKRAKKIEWEHIVPAENFGKSFQSWREPEKFKKCRKKKGGYYNGRTCSEKVEPKFNQMESDIYNLYPAIGALNAIRSNYQIAEIPGEKRRFGKCDFEILNRKVEPPQDKKGDIARTYMYMELTYFGHGIISDKNRKLIILWNNIDPVSDEECVIYKQKKKYQKNINIILDKVCFK